MEPMVLDTVVTTTQEKTPNIFLSMKAAVAGIGTGFTIAFGWLGWLVMAWIACMVLDYTTGTIAAMKDGNWSSAVARGGIFHKAGMMTVVITSAIADGVLGMVITNVPNVEIAYSTALVPMVLIWYIFTELGSIAENATRMGAKVPQFLSNMLAAGQALHGTQPMDK